MAQLQGAQILGRQVAEFAFEVGLYLLVAEILHQHTFNFGSSVTVVHVRRVRVRQHTVEVGAIAAAEHERSFLRPCSRIIFFRCDENRLTYNLAVPDRFDHFSLDRPAFRSNSIRLRMLVVGVDECDRFSAVPIRFIFTTAPCALALRISALVLKLNGVLRGFILLTTSLALVIGINALLSQLGLMSHALFLKLHFPLRFKVRQTFLTILQGDVFDCTAQLRRHASE